MFFKLVFNEEEEKKKEYKTNVTTGCLLPEAIKKKKIKILSPYTLFSVYFVARSIKLKHSQRSHTHTHIHTEREKKKTCVVIIFFLEGKKAFSAVVLAISSLWLFPTLSKNTLHTKTGKHNNMK